MDNSVIMVKIFLQISKCVLSALKIQPRHRQKESNQFEYYGTLMFESIVLCVLQRDPFIQEPVDDIGRVDKHEQADAHIDICASSYFFLSFVYCTANSFNFIYLRLF